MKLLIIADNRVNIYPLKKIVSEGKKVFSEIILANTKELFCHFQKGQTHIYVNNIDIRSFDRIIIKSSFEKTSDFIREFNKSLFQVIDKEKVLNGKYYSKYFYASKTTQMSLLAKLNLPIPETYFGNFENKISLPTVLKNSTENNGKAVSKVNYIRNLIKIKNRYGKAKTIAQSLIKSNCDYRAIVLNNQVLGSMKKTKPKGKFTSNIHQGGKYSQIEAKYKKPLSKIALSVCKKLEIELAGIDIIFDKNDNPYILEINDCPGFEGFDKVNPSVNVAKKIIDYIYSK
ncbi:MAG: YheC/YheD family protein [Patescibacteria group bacterium]